uniref:Uncharacterized protein n=1 Tax=Rousettus aegyptiacus TaxID=9407 RepID=A0A7J8CI48_ROUAE|nr:hypothetical protein HJG63_009013 [Rousettus aegyptiacus]
MMDQVKELVLKTERIIWLLLWWSSEIKGGGLGVVCWGRRGKGTSLGTSMGVVQGPCPGGDSGSTETLYPFPHSVWKLHTYQNRSVAFPISQIKSRCFILAKAIVQEYTCKYAINAFCGCNN